MAHLVRWFTVFKNEDFPVRYVRLSEGTCVYTYIYIIIVNYIYIIHIIIHIYIWNYITVQAGLDTDSDCGSLFSVPKIIQNTYSNSNLMQFVYYGGW